MEQNNQGTSSIQNDFKNKKELVLRNHYSLNEVFQRINTPATKSVTLNDLCKEVKSFIFEHEKQISDLQVGQKYLTNFIERKHSQRRIRRRI